MQKEILRELNQFKGVEQLERQCKLIYDLCKFDYAESFARAKDLQEVVAVMQDKEMDARSLDLLGRLYNLKGNLPKGIDFLKKAEKAALEIEEDYNRNNTLGRIYFDLLYAYANQTKFHAAIETAQKGIKVLKAIDLEKVTVPLLVGIYVNLMGCYLDTQQLDKAAALLPEALEVQQKTQMPDQKLLPLLLQKSQLLVEQGKFEQALQSLDPVQKVIEESQGKFHPHFQHYYYFKARCLYFKQKYEEALKYLEQDEVITRKYQMKNELLKSLELKMKIYEALEDFKSAYSCSNAYWGLQKELTNEEAQFQILQHQYEESLKREQFEKEQLNQLLKEKEDFFSGITHDIRSSLMLLITPIESSIHATANLPQVQKQLEVALKSSKSLMNLSNQLLEVSKLDFKQVALHPIKIDLIQKVLDLWKSFLPQVQSKGLLFRFKSNFNKIVLSIDIGKIERILSNLISNAIKFTQEGELVELLVLYDSYQKELLFEVKDTGIGISEKDQHRIFERFYQVNHYNYSRGVGLGLYVAQKFAELLEGSIQLRSQLELGTTFSLYIPLQNEAIQLQKENVSVENNSNYRQKEGGIVSTSLTDTSVQVLLVEDNLSINEYLQTLLEDAGFGVTTALNGQQALNVMENWSPDIVVSDVMMDVMDGFELCRQIKNDLRLSHLPVVLITSLSEHYYKEEGMEKGADAFIGKPFSPEVLIKTLERLHQRSQKLRKYYYKEFAGVLQPIYQDANKHEKPKEVEFLNKVIACIDKDMQEYAFGVQYMSEVLNIHRRTLYRKINQLLGISVTELIRKRRLLKAKVLIETQPELNIREHAMTVGFSNFSYFSKCFKEEFGILPSELSSK